MISIQDIVNQAQRATQAVAGARAIAHSPKENKIAPIFGTTEVQNICNISPGKLRQLLGSIPGGNQVTGYARREWSLPEFQQWARTLRSDRMRPEGLDAAVVTLANFKGGVSKTTTAVALAQGLSLRGHKVLFVDLDPQASGSELLGFAAESIEDSQTALPIFEGESADIMDSVRETYWSNVDLVSSNLSLYSAEFQLASRQGTDPGFEFWKQLDYSLDRARQIYDVIVIDTAPALSFVSINALDASDGLVMPLPPSMLDYASAAQFWQLFSDLCTQLYSARSSEKSFGFVDILLSKVDAGDTATAQIRQYILETFTSRVLPIEIPKTTATTNAARDLGTIYDANSKSVVAPKTFVRAKTAYDRFAELMEDRLHSVWSDQRALLKAARIQSQGE